ncbi:MAG: thermonuclease family protein [Actinobacteria bacterium]|nr:thermonuclease family protein [Actinomycetota bacterium]
MIRAIALPLLCGAALAVAGCTGDTPSAEEPEPAVETAAGEPAGTSASRAESGVVATVNDGDTITLRDGRKVRLVQIDAPELYDECYGRRARTEAARLTPPGTAVTLQRDPKLDDRDRHGRLLRYVEAGGRNVNGELVARGAAVPYFFRGERGRHAEDLLLAVEEAREQRAGMWAACPHARLNTGIGSQTGPA